MSKCTCYPVPFEDCTTYGSAVEPGSAFEPNPDCPEHFPKGWATYNRKMAVSLVAIQELHKPVHPTFSWNHGITLWEPCPTCQGKAGVHECGCWSDWDIQYVCAECSDFEHGKGKRVSYPCPTRRLTDEALG